MARIIWNGDHLSRKATRAVAAAINETMEACVDRAKEGHPPFNDLIEDLHGRTEPSMRYHERTGRLTESIQVLEPAVTEYHRIPAGVREGGQFAIGGHTGEIIGGRWGSNEKYALFIEIGTSIAGPKAEEREAASPGDSELPLWGASEPIGPRMAPRPYLRPAAEVEYPRLAARIAVQFRGIN